MPNAKQKDIPLESTKTDEETNEVTTFKNPRDEMMAAVAQQAADQRELDEAEFRGDDDPIRS